MKRSQTPSECPVCGEPVPKGARACPHCGADERSGWNEDETRYDGLDLPEEEPSSERGAARRAGVRASSVLWAITAAVVILTLIYLIVRHGAG